MAEPPRVRDERIVYLDAAFRGIRHAINRGVDIRGIFVWTLLNDFEGDAGFGGWRKTPQAHEVSVKTASEMTNEGPGAHPRAGHSAWAGRCLS